VSVNRLTLVVLPAAVVASTLAVVSAAMTDNSSVPLLEALLVGLTGWSFIAAGLIARARRPRNRTGLLLIAVGFSWFLAGGLMSSNEPVAWSLGAAVAPIPAGFLVHLLVAYPSGVLQSVWERAIVTAGYVLTVLGSLPGLLLDKRPISTCDGCPDSAFVVADSDLASTVAAGVVETLAAAFLLAVVLTLARRWKASSPAARRALTPVLLAGAATILLFAVSIATVSFWPTLSDASHWAARIVIAVLPFTFLSGLLQSRLARAEISRALAEEPGVGVQDRIRQLLHDPSAEVLYRCAGPEGDCVDVDGRPREFVAEPGRAVTPIERDGRPLAAIVHDEALLDEPELLEQVAAAVGLEIERDNNLWALQASERRSRAILEAIPDKMFRVRADGIVLDLQEDRKSQPAGLRVGSSVYDAPVSKQHTDRMMATGWRALDTGELQTIEWEVEIHGDVRHAEGRFIPSGDDEFFVVIRDVTERKRQEVERAALHRVALAVASEASAEQIFNLVAEEIGGVLGADSVSLLRFEPGGDEAFILGRWARDEAHVVLTPFGEAIPLEGAPVHRVYKTGRPIRVDLGEPLTPASFRERLLMHKVHSFLAAPIEVSSRLWGAVAVSLAPPLSFPHGAEERLRAFTQLVSLALANEEARGQLAASRARLVSAGDEERRRLERNLHDGAQQRLVSVSVAMRLAQSKLAADPSSADELLEGANVELAVALEELRELARGIHPAVLTERGLGPALASLADRTPLPVALEHPGDERLPRPVEAAAYFVVSEALANVAKYARASHVTVRVAQDDGCAVVEVADDGVGGADPERGSGLRGLVDRVEALDGHLRIESPRGEGTTIRAEIPVRLAALEDTSLPPVREQVSVPASDA
jgi:signal transduction histidine kinase/PAS domain-containing protein